LALKSKREREKKKEKKKKEERRRRKKDKEGNREIRKGRRNCMSGIELIN